MSGYVAEGLHDLVIAAHTLAEQARATLRTFVDERHADARRLTEIEAWLATH